MGVAKAAPYFATGGRDKNLLERILAKAEKRGMEQAFFVNVFDIFMEEKEMNDSEFEVCVKEALERQLPKGTVIETSKVLKNNGAEYQGMVVKYQGSNICPIIYLENYFAMYEEGIPFDEIIEEIWQVCKQNHLFGNYDTSYFLEWNQAREYIVPKLVNYEANRKMLEQSPHRQFLDMAIIYQYIVKADTKEVATITINNFHMDIWGIEEADIYQVACENYPRIMHLSVKSMNQIIGELLEEDAESIISDAMPMYVVTNETLHNGAVSMLFLKEQESMEKMLEQDLYILPSSIHEIIVLPAEDGNVEELIEMVREVNHEHVQVEERLSDHVYRYCHESGRIEIA